MLKGYLAASRRPSRRWHSCVFALAVASLTALAPRFASAQAPPAPEASDALDDKQTARNLFLEGNRLVRQKRWAEAETTFESSLALDRTVEAAFNLGSVEFWLNKPTEAADHLSFAIRAWPDTMAPLLPTAQRLLAQSKQLIGVLKIEVNVPSAEVLIDGSPVGKAPLPHELFVTPGDHTIEARLDGYVDLKEPVSLEKGTERTLHLTLTRTKRPDVKPSAQPDRAATIGAPPERPPPRVDPQGKPRKEIVIAGVATSAAAFTAGAVFAIVSSAKAADADDRLASLVQKGGDKPCSAPSLFPDCRDIDRTNKTSDTFGNLSTWGFIAGGLLGAGTAVYALTSPKWPGIGGLRALPVTTAKGGGLVLLGEW